MPSIPAPVLSQLSEVIAARVGLHFPEERWRDLERAIRSVARDLGFADAETCARSLVAAPMTRLQIAVLAGRLTTGETYFFRDQRCFDTLQAHLLPELVRARQGLSRSIRIWSAGCCTGEEPYSIAIALHQAIGNLEGWDITILGTDITPAFLRKAAEGVYSEWSFRDTPSWIKERYFERAGERKLRILPEYRRMVQFAYLNLADDCYPSLLNNTNALDLIFCRNVLMYFGREHAAAVAERLGRSLVAGGLLLLGPVDLAGPVPPMLVKEDHPGVTAYRKQPSGALAVERRAAVQADAAPAVPAPVPWPEPAPVVPVPEPRRHLAPPSTPAPGGHPFPPAPQPGGEEPAAGPAAYEGALALYEQGRYGEAAVNLRELLGARAGAYPGAMPLLVRAYANLGRLPEAEEWCRRAVAEEKLDPGLHYLLATIFQERGQLADAAAALDRALYLEPRLVVAHFALGRLARQQGRPRDARRHFANARRLLDACPPDEILPESEGLTAGALLQVLAAAGAEEET